MYTIVAMKINNSLKKTIDNLIETKEINMNIADMLLSTFPYEDIVIKEDIESLMKTGKNEKKAYFAILLNYFGIPEDDIESVEIARRYIYKYLECCEPDYYLNNSYVQAIKPAQFKEDGYELTYLKYSPYQLLPVDEIIVEGNDYKELYKVGYFQKEFKYLALIKNDEIWMSVNPNEINTMKPFIKKANGEVLVLGLGMGYIAYMMSLKEEVNSITIIEKDTKIIDIFKKHLYPLFINKEKIKVVHDDAIRYLENCKKYDYIFADLWHNPEDGLPLYLQIENIKNKRGFNVDYWLDTSLKAMKRRCLLTILQEYFLGYTEKDYKYAKDPMDQVINKLYKDIKDININNEKELKKLID